ncbi:MAG TPA: hypothetical protein VG458_07320, partial [Solirubrobacterales bacterium]|nr:hypothetical protein [Solirubrobacterales bacterium]
IEIMLSGPGGAEVAPDLAAAFAVAADEERNVLLSFESCGYLDPEALGPIRMGRRQLEQDGIEVHVFGAPERVRAAIASR